MIRRRVKNKKKAFVQGRSTCPTDKIKSHCTFKADWALGKMKEE